MRYASLTYNVNNQNITANFDKIANNIKADTIFICLQEAYLPISKINKLISAIKIAFPSHHILRSKRLFGLVSILLSKRNEGSVKPLKFGLGPLYFPNKGFIAMKYNNTIFINCHLKPHENNNHTRLEMIDSIISAAKTYFKSFEGIILSGDLNFRIKRNEMSEALYKNGDFEKLRKYDEGLDFLPKYNFKEGAIGFKPTFKFINNTYNSKRFPGWCDRILVNFDKIEIEEYTSLDINISDHKPVICHFKILQSDKIMNLDVKKDENIKTKIMLGNVYSNLYTNFNLTEGIFCLILFFYLLWKIKRKDSIKDYKTK